MSKFQEVAQKMASNCRRYFL